MPRVTKDWVARLDLKDLDKVLALMRYAKQAEVLAHETDQWWNHMWAPRRRENTRIQILHSVFMPYYMMLVSMLVVFDGGFVELAIEDKQIEKIKQKLDMKLLRRFRNAAFHFQPYYHSPKHDEYINKNGFGATWDMWNRQDLLVKRMGRYIKYNPAAATPTRRADRPG